MKLLLVFGALKECIHFWDTRYTYLFILFDQISIIYRRNAEYR
jgi:hypothetical protein